MALDVKVGGWMMCCIFSLDAEDSKASNKAEDLPLPDSSYPGMMADGLFSFKAHL